MVNYTLSLYMTCVWVSEIYNWSWSSNTLPNGEQKGTSNV